MHFHLVAVDKANRFSKLAGTLFDIYWIAYGSFLTTKADVAVVNMNAITRPYVGESYPMVTSHIYHLNESLQLVRICEAVLCCWNDILKPGKVSCLTVLM